MKAFLAAFLGVTAAGVALIVGLFLLGPSDAWQTRKAEWIARWDGLNGEPNRHHAARKATGDFGEKRDALRANHALQEQRRQFLALLAANPGTKPLGRLAATEKYLFQEAERELVRQSTVPPEPHGVIHLVEPVQIDEHTVLRCGTPVQFVHYDRDSVITIRHEGARYQVSPTQTNLR